MTSSLPHRAAGDPQAESPRPWRSDPTVRRILRNAGYLDDEQDSGATGIAARR